MSFSIFPNTYVPQNNAFVSMNQPQMDGGGPMGNLGFQNQPSMQQNMGIGMQPAQPLQSNTTFTAFGGGYQVPSMQTVGGQPQLDNFQLASQGSVGGIVPTHSRRGGRGRGRGRNQGVAQNYTSALSAPMQGGPGFGQSQQPSQANQGSFFASSQMPRMQQMSQQQFGTGMNQVFPGVMVDSHVPVRSKSSNRRNPRQSGLTYPMQPEMAPGQTQIGIGAIDPSAFAGQAFHYQSMGQQVPPAYPGAADTRGRGRGRGRGGRGRGRGGRVDGIGGMGMMEQDEEMEVDDGARAIKGGPRQSSFRGQSQDARYIATQSFAPVLPPDSQAQFGMPFGAGISQGQEFASMASTAGAMSIPMQNLAPDGFAASGPMAAPGAMDSAVETGNVSIFVSRIHPNTTEAELRQHFLAFGKIQNISFRSTKGTCKIDYSTPAEAERAIQYGRYFKNRRMTVLQFLSRSGDATTAVAPGAMGMDAAKPGFGSIQPFGMPAPAPPLPSGPPPPLPAFQMPPAAPQAPSTFGAMQIPQPPQPPQPFQPPEPQAFHVPVRSTAFPGQQMEDTLSGAQDTTEHAPRKWQIQKRGTRRHMEPTEDVVASAVHVPSTQAQPPSESQMAASGGLPIQKRRETKKPVTRDLRAAKQQIIATGETGAPFRPQRRERFPVAGQEAVLQDQFPLETGVAATTDETQVAPGAGLQVKKRPVRPPVASVSARKARGDQQGEQELEPKEPRSVSTAPVPQKIITWSRSQEEAAAPTLGKAEAQPEISEEAAAILRQREMRARLLSRKKELLSKSKPEETDIQPSVLIVSAPQESHAKPVILKKPTPSAVPVVPKKSRPPAAKIAVAAPPAPRQRVLATLAVAFRAFEAPRIPDLPPNTPISTVVQTLVPHSVFQVHTDQVSEFDGQIGECMAMCSAARVTQMAQCDDLARFDTAVGSETEYELAVQPHKRSAAGVETELTDLRPPQILIATLHHLLCRVLDADRGPPDPRFPDANGNLAPPETITISAYLWDRTRAILRDLSTQKYRDGGRNDAWAQEILENTIRCSILFNFILTSIRTSSYSSQIGQNEEQLVSQLKALSELYDDARKRSIPGLAVLSSPHEAEFRSYELLFGLEDKSFWSDNKMILSRLPKEIQKSPYITNVLKAWTAFSTGNINRLLQIITQMPFLQACLMLRIVPRARERYLQSITQSFGAPGMLIDMQEVPHVPTTEAEQNSFSSKFLHWSDFASLLFLDSEEAVKRLCDLYGIRTLHNEESELVLVLRGNRVVSQSGEKLKSSRTIEPHLLSRTDVLSPVQYPRANIGSRHPRRDVVYRSQWARQGISAAWAPLGSTSGLFPTGSRFATELFPLVPGSTSWEEIKALSIQRRRQGVVSSATVPQMLPEGYVPGKVMEYAPYIPPAALVESEEEVEEQLEEKEEFFVPLPAVVSISAQSTPASTRPTTTRTPTAATFITPIQPGAFVTPSAVTPIPPKLGVSPPEMTAEPTLPTTGFVFGAPPPSSAPPGKLPTTPFFPEQKFAAEPVSFAQPSFAPSPTTQFPATTMPFPHFVQPPSEVQDAIVSATGFAPAPKGITLEKPIVDVELERAKQEALRIERHALKKQEERREKDRRMYQQRAYKLSEIVDLIESFQDDIAYVFQNAAGISKSIRVKLSGYGILLDALHGSLVIAAAAMSKEAKSASPRANKPVRHPILPQIQALIRSPLSFTQDQLNVFRSADSESATEDVLKELSLDYKELVVLHRELSSSFSDQLNALINDAHRCIAQEERRIMLLARADTFRLRTKQRLRESLFRKWYQATLERHLDTKDSDEMLDIYSYAQVHQRPELRKRHRELSAFTSTSAYGINPLPPLSISCVSIPPYAHYLSPLATFLLSHASDLGLQNFSLSLILNSAAELPLSVLLQSREQRDSKVQPLAVPDLLAPILHARLHDRVRFQLGSHSGRKSGPPSARYQYFDSGIREESGLDLKPSDPVFWKAIVIPPTSSNTKYQDFPIWYEDFCNVILPPASVTSREMHSSSRSNTAQYPRAMRNLEGMWMYSLDDVPQYAVSEGFPTSLTKFQSLSITGNTPSSVIKSSPKSFPQATPMEYEDAVSSSFDNIDTASDSTFPCLLSIHEFDPRSSQKQDLSGTMSILFPICLRIRMATETSGSTNTPRFVMSAKMDTQADQLRLQQALNHFYPDGGIALGIYIHLNVESDSLSQLASDDRSDLDESWNDLFVECNINSFCSKDVDLSDNSSCLQLVYSSLEKALALIEDYVTQMLQLSHFPPLLVSSITYHIANRRIFLQNAVPHMYQVYSTLDSLEPMSLLIASALYLYGLRSSQTVPRNSPIYLRETLSLLGADQLSLTGISRNGVAYFLQELSANSKPYPRVNEISPMNLMRRMQHHLLATCQLAQEDILAACSNLELLQLESGKPTSETKDSLHVPHSGIITPDPDATSSKTNSPSIWSPEVCSYVLQEWLDLFSKVLHPITGDDDSMNLFRNSVLSAPRNLLALLYEVDFGTFLDIIPRFFPTLRLHELSTLLKTSFTQSKAGNAPSPLSLVRSAPWITVITESLQSKWPQAPPAPREEGLLGVFRWCLDWIESVVSTISQSHIPQFHNLQNGIVTLPLPPVFTSPPLFRIPMDPKLQRLAQRLLQTWQRWILQVWDASYQLFQEKNVPDVHFIEPPPWVEFASIILEFNLSHHLDNPVDFSSNLWQEKLLVPIETLQISLENISKLVIQRVLRNIQNASPEQLGTLLLTGISGAQVIQELYALEEATISVLEESNQAKLFATTLYEFDKKEKSVPDHDDQFTKDLLLVRSMLQHERRSETRIQPLCPVSALKSEYLNK